MRPAPFSLAWTARSRAEPSVFGAQGAQGLKLPSLRLMLPLAQAVNSRLPLVVL